MTERIENVWEINNENQSHVSKVDESISSLAAVSEEISSSMAEMENQLKNNTVVMRDVSKQLKKAVEPVEEIEHTLDEAVKQMGDMTEDAFYHLENQEFAKYLSNAINAHRSWLANLKKMVDNRSIVPLQLNSAKCGFGHFYYAMNPSIPGVKPIWDELGPKHQKFHQFGGAVMDALKNDDYVKAESIYREAENYSKELIKDMESIIQLSR